MTASTDYPDRWRRAASAPTQNATSEAVVSGVDSYVAALTPDQFDQLVAPHPRPLMINIAMTDDGHAKALLTATTDCGGTLPKALSDLVDSLGAVAKAGTITDPTNDLIKAVLAGTLRGDELDERIAQKGYSLWNAMLAWHSPRDTWQVALSSQNLFDQAYSTNGFSIPPISILSRYYGPPRTTALSVTWSF